jgi:thioredoxin-like negative regulator of GroEL
MSGIPQISPMSIGDAWIESPQGKGWIMVKLIDSEKKLAEALKNEDKLMVLFYAPWCPYSRAFLPVFEKHAKQKGFCQVDVDSLPDCEDKYSVDVLPTVLYFEKGKVVKRLDGEHARGLDEKQFLEMMKKCDL